MSWNDGPTIFLFAAWHAEHPAVTNRDSGVAARAVPAAASTASQAANAHLIDDGIKDSRLKPGFAEQIDEPSRARRQRWMVDFELYGDFFEPIGQRRDRRISGRRGRRFRQALDIQHDLAQQLARAGLQAAHVGQFLMQFFDLIVQCVGIHDSTPRENARRCRAPIGASRPRPKRHYTANRDARTRSGYYAKAYRRFGQIDRASRQKNNSLNWN